MTNFNRISNQSSFFSSADALKSHQASCSQTASSQPASSQTAYSPIRRLEQLWQLPSANRRDNFQQPHSALTHSALKQLGKRILAFLLGKQKVRIWTSYDKGGIVWHAYDPITDRRFSHASENDLRIWLETRHLN